MSETEAVRNEATEATAATQATEATHDLGEWRAARLVGLLLLLPAAAMLTASYLIPTVWTIQTGLADNHVQTLLDGGYLDRFGFAASVMIWPVIVVMVLAWLVAYLTNRAGRLARWIIRLALVLPMVALAPTAFAVAWRLDRVAAGEPVDAASAQWLVRGAVAWTMFGLLMGVGVTVYLTTLKARKQTRAGAATFVVAVLAGLATLAVGLQLYTYPMVLAGGGDAAAQTPLTVMFGLIAAGETGQSAAAAMLLLAALAGLGLLAVLLAVATGLRIEVPPVRKGGGPEPEADPRERKLPPGVDRFHGTKASARHPEAVVLSLVALVLVLAATGYGLWPWLSRLFQFREEDASQVLVNTWLPPLVGAVVGMLAAVLAGFAIGALRPIGKASPLLLLLFAPWLFVGNGVLSGYELRRFAGTGLSDSFVALIPPGWVVVPAVVVFTLLFRGQEPRWRQLRADGLGLGAATRRALVLPSLPLFWLVGAITWLVHAQSLSWNLVAAGDDPAQAAGPAALVAQLPDDPAGWDPAIGLVLPFVVILVFAAGLAVLQVTYLDRLTIRVGKIDV